MRKLLWVCLLLAFAAPTVGCIIPQLSSNRDIRARQSIFQSEDLRHVPEIWERAWALDMPDLATPYRVHGGVI